MTEKVNTLIITTSGGEEYHYSDERAKDLFNAYEGAVAAGAPWIYTKGDGGAQMFQIIHIASVHVRFGDFNA